MFPAAQRAKRSAGPLKTSGSSPPKMSSTATLAGTSCLEGDQNDMINTSRALGTFWNGGSHKLCQEEESPSLKTNQKQDRVIGHRKCSTELVESHQDLMRIFNTNDPLAVLEPATPNKWSIFMAMKGGRGETIGWELNINLNNRYKPIPSGYVGWWIGILVFWQNKPRD